MSDSDPGEDDTTDEDLSQRTDEEIRKQTHQQTDEESPVDRVTEAAGSGHVTYATGVFAAFGAALVLAVFMSSAFTGGGQPLAIGLPLVLLGAALLAVFTGTVASRSEGVESSGALAATIGGIVGVFAVYVAYYVIGGALSVGVGTISIGPLIGWAIGIGIVAGTSALFVAAIEQRSASLDVGVSWDDLVYPIGAFVAFGLGLLVGLFAAGELADNGLTVVQSFPGGGGLSTTPAAAAPPTVLLFAPILGLLVGLLTSGAEGGVDRIGAALIGAGVGFLLAYVVVFGLAHALEPDAMDGNELQYGQLVGVAVGVGIASGLGSWAADLREGSVSSDDVSRVPAQ
jgi:hypothetical protein